MNRSSRLLALLAGIPSLITGIRASHALDIARVSGGLTTVKDFVIGDGYVAVAAILGIFGVVRGLAASNLQAVFVTMGIAAIGALFISVIS